jgi:hypothetical protein
MCRGWFAADIAPVFPLEVLLHRGGRALAGLQLTDNAGHDFPASVFLYPPKNDTIRINGQELIRPSNK